MSIPTTLAEHEVALLVLTNREVRAVLRALVDSERQILADLRGAEDLLERANLARLARQVAIWRADLESRLGAAFTVADAAAIDLAGVHLGALAAAHGPAGLVYGPGARLRAAAALASQRALGLAAWQAGGLSARAAGRVQSALVAGVVQEQSAGEIVARVQAAGGPMAVNRREAELLVRMEMSRAYSQAGGEMAAALYEEDNRWRKRIVETIDDRNHPFSRVSNGVMAKPGELFRVSAQAVAAEAAAMGVRLRTVLWPQRGGHYKGMNLPAHYGERGRVVPWHLDWGP